MSDTWAWRASHLYHLYLNMHFLTDNIYHVYNRGNNRQPIFFHRANYIYFLKKVRSYLYPRCRLLAWVLMPNHFHFLLQADERSCIPVTHGSVTRSALSEGFRLLLSAYSKGINKQQGFTGNLIQQKTKEKCLFDTANPKPSHYPLICFYYIHQNPQRAGLVHAPDDWEWSSFRDYAGQRNGTLCAQERALSLLNISPEFIMPPSCLSDEDLKGIW